MTQRALLLRADSTPEGTPGVLIADGFSCHTLELPWRDNVRKLSCIPDGAYECVMVRSPRFGVVYHVRGVPGRSEILIHAGNLAGALPRFRADVQGCILLGERVGRINSQRAVLVSRPAVRRFNAAMQMKPFELEVRWNR